MQSIRQVSRRLGISRSLTYAEIQAGNLVAHRFGKRTYRVSEEDLANYIEQHKHVGTTPEMAAASSANTAPSHPQKFQHLDVSRLLGSQTQQVSAEPGASSAPSSKLKCARATGSSSSDLPS